MQDEMLRHHLVMHASRLDTSPWSERRCWTSPAQIGAVKCKDKKRKDFNENGKGELMQAEKEKDDAKKAGQELCDNQCFYFQKKGHISSDCRNRQRDMMKTRESGKSFVDRKETAAVTEDEYTGAARVSPTWPAAATTTCLP